MFRNLISELNLVMFEFCPKSDYFVVFDQTLATEVFEDDRKKCSSFSLKVIPTDFLSRKFRIIVVVISKWAADNRKCLVRTDWKIGLFTEKKVRTEKQAKDRGCFIYILGMLKAFFSCYIMWNVLWWIIMNKRLSVCMHEWL